MVHRFCAARIHGIPAIFTRSSVQFADTLVLQNRAFRKLRGDIGPLMNIGRGADYGNIGNDNVIKKEIESWKKTTGRPSINENCDNYPLECNKQQL